MPIYLPKTVRDEATQLVSQVLDSGNLAEGEFNDAKTIQESYIAGSGDHAVNKLSMVFTSSCGAGLMSVLKVLKVDRILIQSNTMYCLRTIGDSVGAEVVVVDADPATMIMSPEDLEHKLSKLPEDGKRTAVLPSHIGGGTHPSLVDLLEVARRFGAFFIEDMAHALGNNALPIGDAGVFSMYATKSIPAGEGGIVTGTPDLVAKVREYLIYDRYKMESPSGMNVRVSETQAALMNASLRGMHTIVNARMGMWVEYATVCDELGISYKHPDATPMDHNGYKFIIDDQAFLEAERKSQVLKNEGVLSGTVFGYNMYYAFPKEGSPAIPHICLNTNPTYDYDTSDELLVESTVNAIRKVHAQC